jgi:hypothetical protein
MHAVIFFSKSACSEFRRSPCWFNVESEMSYLNVAFLRQNFLAKEVFIRKLKANPTIYAHVT